MNGECWRADWFRITLPSSQNGPRWQSNGGLSRACSILSILLSLVLRVLHAGAGHWHTSTTISGLRGAATPLSIYLRSRLRFLSSDSQYITAPLYENRTSAALDWRFITSTLWHTLLYSLQQLLIPSGKNDVVAWTISTPLVCLWYFRRDMVSSNTCSRRIPRVGSLRKPPDRGVDDGQSS